VADGVNAIETRKLLAEANKATQGVEQKNGDERDPEEPYRMPQRKENDARDENERSQPGGLTRYARHPVQWLVRHPVERLARDLVQRLAVLRRILVSGRGSAVKFDCVGNLTKALTFSPERAAGVAECRVSEHAGLIHAFDASHDPGPQQQSTLLDQLGHF